MLALVSVATAQAGNTVVSVGYMYHTDTALEDNKNQFNRTTFALTNINAGDWGRITSTGIIENLDQTSSNPTMGDGTTDAWTTAIGLIQADIKTGISGLNLMVLNHFWFNTNGYENSFIAGVSYDYKLGPVKMYTSLGGLYELAQSTGGTTFQGFSGYQGNIVAILPMTDSLSVKATGNFRFDRDDEYVDLIYGNSKNGGDKGYMATLGVNYKVSKNTHLGLDWRHYESFHGYKQDADVILAKVNFVF